MTSWIYVTSSDNWKVTRERNILGAAEGYKTLLSRVHNGDKILVYVKAERVRGTEVTKPIIVGEYEVSSEVFTDKTKIFHTPPNDPNQIFGLRMRVKAVRIFKEPIHFRLLVPKLGFITNKRNWPLHLRGRPITKLPENDFDLIMSAASP
jgi:predicted RNA-binding protein